MIRAVIVAIAALIAGVLLFAATRPDVFRVERRIAIQAPPDRVFGLINDFRQWGAWSPWEKKDPAMRRSFGTVTAGTGARYAWEGNKDVGRGSMEITESLPPARIRLRLDFVEPFEAHNTVTFTLTPQGTGTGVNWAMEGPVPYFAKILHLFIDMDAMVGGDFETGLASLKALAEK